MLYDCGKEGVNLAKKKLASLSLDLDNTWSYLKIHGDENWRNYPSHFPTFVPLILDLLKEFDLKITFFIVGQDAQIDENKVWLKQITDAGHEVGNHSYHHEPWIQNESFDDVYQELKTAHEAILDATGKAPIGYRGPGFSHSPSIFKAIQKLDYQFDASVLPTSIAPIARLYYKWNMKQLPKEEMEKRGKLFGGLSSALLPNTPFIWETDSGSLLELPVTTTPCLRLPFHLSYLIWLLQYSETLSWSYLKANISLCKLFNISPSILLHPPDFLGKESLPGLTFFPGIKISSEKKVEFAKKVFRELKKNFDIAPMSEHVKSVQLSGIRKIET